MDELLPRYHDHPRRCRMFVPSRHAIRGQVAIARGEAHGQCTYRWQQYWTRPYWCQEVAMEASQRMPYRPLLLVRRHQRLSILPPQWRSYNLRPHHQHLLRLHQSPSHPPRYPTQRLFRPLFRRCRSHHKQKNWLASVFHDRLYHPTFRRVPRYGVHPQ